MEAISVLFLKYMLFLVFILFTARIDADHYNKGQWVTNKVPRFMQRASAVFFGCIASGGSVWEFAAWGVLFWAYFDQALNTMRKDVGLWHVGDRGIDSLFFGRPILYKLSKLAALVLGHYFFYLYLR